MPPVRLTFGINTCRDASARTRPYTYGLMRLGVDHGSGNFADIDDPQRAMADAAVADHHQAIGKAAVDLGEDQDALVVLREGDVQGTRRTQCDTHPQDLSGAQRMVQSTERLDVRRDHGRRQLFRLPTLAL